MTFEQTITDMGILANEAYDDQNKYFVFENGQRKESLIVTANNTYTIIDSIDTVNSMQALLLKDTQGNFIISFRGTKEPLDGFYDVTTGLLNYNPQIPDATAFVNAMLVNHANIGLTQSNLTLTGHSLGGILAQTIASTQNLEAYTFNAWSSSNFINYSSHQKAS